jgi:hypothetical protein
MQYDSLAPEICVGYSRFRRFGNNQTMKPDKPNIGVDSGPHDYNLVYLPGKWNYWIFRWQGGKSES